LINFKKKILAIGATIGAIFISRIVVVEIMRHFFFRLRPFAIGQGNYLPIDQNSAEPSMPSGHAALFFALATAVYFYNKKLGIFLFISAFLISISRVFVGVHWPSDILAGALVGIFSGWLVYKIFNKYYKLKTP
jgi:undecaprenyl-diphosphatase